MGLNIICFFHYFCYNMDFSTHSSMRGLTNIYKIPSLLFRHSVVSDFATPWTAVCQASLSFTILLSLFKSMSSESGMPSNHLVRCCPLLLLPSIFPSSRLFFNESALHIRWPKYWSFSFSISPSSQYSGLISFRIYWFCLLAVQGLSGAFSNTTVRKWCSVL